MTAHVKGSALRSFVVWYVERHDDRPLRRAVAELPEELRAGLDPDDPAFGLLPSTWYPAPTIHRMLDALMEHRSPAERHELAREASRVVVRDSVKGLYRFLFRKLSTPSLYARHIGRAWAHLHDTGERTMTLTGEGEAESIVRSWEGHHVLLCEVATETMVTLFELMGCRDVEALRTACVSRGDVECRTILRWSSGPEEPPDDGPP